MSAPTASAQFPLVIDSNNDGVAYLTVRPCVGNHGIIISEQPRRKKLNSFWKVWVREELRTMPAEHVREISLTKRDVWFVSRHQLDDWIEEACSRLANVSRLGDPPVRLYEWRNRPEDGQRLWVDPRADLTRIVDSITLPKGMREHYSISGGIGSIFIIKRGVGSRKCVFPLNEVRQYVELQIALDCRASGVPLNLDERPARLFYPDGSAVV